MTEEQRHQVWAQHPVGKTPKGSLCECCARYNVRNSTIEAIVVRDRKILMILRARDPQKGWWGLVGGYVDWDETLEQCVQREVKEEVGIIATKIEFLGLFDDPQRDLDGRQNIGHCFVVSEFTGDIHKEDLEVEKVAWFDLDNLPEKIAFDHRKMIEAYIQKNA